MEFEYDQTGMQWFNQQQRLKQGAAGSATGNYA
jgi:hypothetical protein